MKKHRIFYLSLADEPETIYASMGRYLLWRVAIWILIYIMLFGGISTP